MTVTGDQLDGPRPEREPDSSVAEAARRRRLADGFSVSGSPSHPFLDAVIEPVGKRLREIALGTSTTRRIQDSVTGSFGAQYRDLLLGSYGGRSVLDSAIGPVGGSVRESVAGMLGGRRQRELLDQVSGRAALAGLAGTLGKRDRTDTLAMFSGREEFRSVADSLGASIRESVGGTLSAPYRNALLGSFSARSVLGSVTDPLGASLRESLVSISPGRILGEQYFSSFRETLKRLRPRNLRDIEDLDIAAVRKIMAEEGVPFYLVPDPGTVVAVLAAADATERRSVLQRRSDEIFGSCEEILALCVDPGVSYFGSLLRTAITAYRDGHHQAAQALATTVLDTALAQHGAKMHRDILLRRTTLPGGVNGSAYAETLSVREWFALAPLDAAHMKVDGPRAAYSRHATVHWVAADQYVPGNAVQAIMLAVGVLGFAQGLR